jgi:hypothetical protein
MISSRQVFFLLGLHRESCSFESCRLVFLFVCLLLLFFWLFFWFFWLRFVDSIKESRIVAGRLDGRVCWLCDTVEVAESPQVLGYLEVVVFSLIRLFVKGPVLAG